MRSASRLGLHPDPPAVTLDNLSTNGQTDPRTLILVAPMQAIEGGENLLVIFRFDPDPVVAHAEEPLTLLTLADQVYLRLAAPFGELEGVAEEILIHLGEQGRVAQHVRQRIAGDFGPALLNLNVQGAQRLIRGLTQGDPFSPQCRPPRAGKGEQVLHESPHSLGRFGDETEVLPGGLGERSTEVLGQELAEGGDLPQRLLKVVARDVRELIEIHVLAAKLLVRDAEGLVGEGQRGG